MCNGVNINRIAIKIVSDVFFVIFTQSPFIQFNFPRYFIFLVLTSRRKLASIFHYLVSISSILNACVFRTNIIFTAFFQLLENIEKAAKTTFVQKRHAFNFDVIYTLGRFHQCFRLFFARVFRTNVFFLITFLLRTKNARLKREQKRW